MTAIELFILPFRIFPNFLTCIGSPRLGWEDVINKDLKEMRTS